MTGYSFGDVVLVSFPFTDQATAKQRPAVVISSEAYHQAKPDLIVMAVTSHVRAIAGVGEVLVQDWQIAGLLKPSMTKPVITTIEPTLVRRMLGRLKHEDQNALNQAIHAIVG